MEKTITNSRPKKGLCLEARFLAFFLSVLLAAGSLAEPVLAADDHGEMPEPASQALEEYSAETAGYGSFTADEFGIDEFTEDAAAQDATWEPAEEVLEPSSPNAGQAGPEGDSSEMVPGQAEEDLFTSLDGNESGEYEESGTGASELQADPAMTDPADSSAPVEVPSAEAEAETGWTADVPSAEAEVETEDPAEYPSAETEAEAGWTADVPSAEAEVEIEDSAEYPSAETEAETGWTADIPSAEAEVETADPENSFSSSEQEKSNLPSVNMEVNEEHTVSFDANGGYFPGEEYDEAVDQFVTDAEILTLETDDGDELSPPDPVISDRSLAFAGWSREKNGEILIDADTWYFTPTEDCTLYAVWSEAYAVTMDANGGYYIGVWDDFREEDIDEKTDSYTVKVVKGKSLSLAIPHNTDSAMVLNGWSDTRNGEIVRYRDKEYYAETSNRYKPTKDCTLYAVWKDSYEYHNTIITVKLDANGGVFPFAEDDELDDFVANAKVITKKFSAGSTEWLPDPEHDDPWLGFLGWGINNRENLDITDKEAEDFSPVRDETLYAIWGSRFKPVTNMLTGSCGDNLTWELDTDGTLTIYGVGTMYESAEAGKDYAYGWKGNEAAISSIVIQEGVTGIGSGAFKGLDLVKSASLPDSLIQIGAHAFENCESLQTVKIPSGIRRIESRTFKGCERLTDVEVPESVVFIGSNAFLGTPWQHDMGEYAICNNILMQYQGNSFTVTIPDGVTSIAGMAFEGTEFVKKIILPASVTRIEDYAFDFCCELKEINLPSGLTYLGDSFEECVNLRSIVIPSSITEIQHGTFYDCDKLNSVTIPASVVSIGERAFDDCDAYLVIYGYKGTTAEQYADDNSIVFRDLNAQAHQMSEASISGVSNRIYTGSAHKPVPLVKIGSATLEAGYDYTVAYCSNINAGTAKIILTGRGNYKGQVTRTFKISPADQSISAKATRSAIAVNRTATVSISGARGAKSFTSSNPAVATVDRLTGKVTGKKVGTVTITATSAATSNYRKAAAKVTIKVLPAATTRISAVNLAKGFRVTWNKVPGANGYILYRNGTRIKTFTSGATVTYTDTNANSNGKKYSYKIVAKASTGTSPLSRSMSIYRITRPALTSVRNSASKKMTIAWGKISGAGGYQLQYGKRSNFSSVSRTYNISGNKTFSRTIGRLTAGTTYYVRIRTFRTVGGKKYFSAWSAVKKLKIAR